MVRKLPPVQPVKVTKLQAALHQLETAIVLSFHDGSPVSILALAHAAHEVIHRLYRAKGLKDDLIFNASFIDEDYRDQWNLDIKKAPNFFKHTNRADPNEEFEFDARLGDAFMLMSLVALHRMGIPPIRPGLALLAWFALTYPADTVREDLAAKGVDVDQLADRPALRRNQFLEYFLKHHQSGA